MKRTINRGLLLVALTAPAFVSGCASMSKKDCLAGDWAGRGFEDGSRGRSANFFDQHIKACAKVDVVPDRTLYQDGFDQGVLVYCTPETGYRVGLRNADYQGICPPELERPFLQQYLDGLESKLTRLDDEYDSAQSSLESDRVLRASLAGADVPKKLRRSIDYGENRVSSLRTERRSLRDKISRWRRAL